MNVVGIDLAVYERNPSGICIIKNKDENTLFVKTLLLYTDDEIIDFVSKQIADVVAIDAPLTMPIKGASREIYGLMRKKGMRAFPELFGFMKKLTERGIRLASAVKKYNIQVIEIHPRSSLFNMNVSRKDLFAAFPWLKNLTKDEIDAFVAAVTGLAYLLNEYEELSGIDGSIIFPSQSFMMLLTSRYKLYYVRT
ncbi:MAG: DUF429 domain-containing protein [Candidatus Asgardarchaeum californiense]|nr:MAG: DUF429 domain-containing protein [Candidatus Asgardarchaeum californiense]